ncbi:methyltransferase [Pararobbsia alpina]|uniref:Release factor glutamine methyltransferase n=1 Tax=Pararobbsia alpina TaxID=621374 RepID=A0A6S7B6D0_9BURK|nr:class I SAM-dependent methyltransferase [Pararobbsia alpina]CAB3779118.1 Release factor glutamine methyltransferase [Pararobbsia alpina]
MNSYPLIEWTENGEVRAVRWRSENGSPPPRRVVVADDTLTADTAYRLACEGTGLLWRGDFQNARQLLQAIARRADRPPRRKKRPEPESPVDAFNQYRQAQSQRSRTLNMLLIPIEGDFGIALRRAPDLQQACLEAYGAPDGQASVASLRELQGLIGAHEWRKKGVEIAVLGDRIHAHHGVFSPVRGEYLDLVAKAPLPAATHLAFDIGTGTGVLAALLAKRGISRVIATDQDPRALACARENIERLGYAKQVQVVEADLFPPGKAPLIVCNPPWLPARPSSPLEHAIYDPESRMLKGFIAGLGAHLEPGGEGWLVLSDIAEHIGLRSRDELLAAFAAAGLKVLDKISIRPTHPKVADVDDPLHAARALELTSIWRLARDDAGKA